MNFCFFSIEYNLPGEFYFKKQMETLMNLSENRFRIFHFILFRFIFVFCKSFLWKDFFLLKSCATILETEFDLDEWVQQREPTPRLSIHSFFPSWRRVVATVASSNLRISVLWLELFLRYSRKYFIYYFKACKQELVDDNNDKLNKMFQ